MSFGRRLALFFLLIALLPALTMLAMLVIVNEDSREGKADARLAAGVETAAALYEQRVARARALGEQIAGDPGLARALADSDRAALRRFARAQVGGGRIESLAVLGPADAPLAAAGGDDAVAHATLVLTSAGDPRGSMRVSATPATGFASQLRRLSGRELVLRRDGEELAATVPARADGVEPGETGDVEAGGREYRGRALALEGGETLLLLGPRTEGGFLAVERPAAILLLVFLALGIALAWALARTLTGLHDRVAEQAVTDPLTGLWNRRRLRALLDREVDRAERFGHETSLLIVDVDDFKATNDRHGHPAGDAVLREIADVVRDETRAIDVCARYGGDELALLLVETDAAGAKVVAERLRSRIAATELRLDSVESLPVTVSIGAATFPASADGADALVEAADQALLRAKRAGKNKLRRAPARRRAARN